MQTVAARRSVSPMDQHNIVKLKLRSKNFLLFLFCIVAAMPKIVKPQ